MAKRRVNRSQVIRDYVWDFHKKAGGLPTPKQVEEFLKQRRLKASGALIRQILFKSRKELAEKAAKRGRLPTKPQRRMVINKPVVGTGRSDYSLLFAVKSLAEMYGGVEKIEEAAKVLQELQ